MILKGSQRGGPRALAAHLLNDQDNDHVALAQIQGFATDDLCGAMAEVQAISKGTRCRQPVFSLSLSPPKGAVVTTDELIAAVDRAEDALGLTGQSRAVVIHEKEGRKHAHAVWSRIDGETMTAINLSFFKFKLKALSRELYLENGWELPDGHRSRASRNPLNFTLAEWQEASRLDIDPREIKQAFRTAWDRSDNLASFSNAMESQGYFLAKGDRRAIVALDFEGNIFSVSRWAGISVRHKLGNGESLPSVETVSQRLKRKTYDKAREWIADAKAKRVRELEAPRQQIRKMKAEHEAERASLARQQETRSRSEAEERSDRFRRGLGIVMDLLTGRLFALRKQNEREAYEAALRDRAQREQLLSIQMKEREELQRQIDEIKKRQKFERARTARNVMAYLKYRRDRPERDLEYER